MGCLDADTLFELFARGPRAEGRESVERHLDACAACRELVALHARACDESSDGPTLTDEARERSERTGGVGGETPDDVARAATVSSVAPASSAHAHAGDLVAGRYVLERVVGEGGMGVVWAARDRVRGRAVALKILKEASPELATRSLREARASSAIGHPSILEVLDVVAPPHSDAAPILVMPLLEGESLDRLLARKRPLDAAEALAVLEPVVAGMAAAHARGVVHRDLKPANVFLAVADDGGAPVVFVLDFGLAKLLGGSDAAADKLTRTGAVLGTPFYMAPEQLFGDARVDEKADVWAIGVMLYECLSGRRPIEGRSYGQIAKSVASGAIVPLREHVPSLDAELAAICERMLAKEPAERPSLTEVHVVMRSALER